MSGEIKSDNYNNQNMPIPMKTDENERDKELDLQNHDESVLKKINCRKIAIK